jgi:hypothetical protein
MLEQPLVEVLDSQDLSERVSVDGRTCFARAVDQRT